MSDTTNVTANVIDYDEIWGSGLERRLAARDADHGNDDPTMSRRLDAIARAGRDAAETAKRELDIDPELLRQPITG